MTIKCPLCSSHTETFFRDAKHHFLLCSGCHGIVRDPDQLLTETQERERYLHHRNDMEDKGYYQFILPILEQVKHLHAKGARGLDFGCGHTPVLSNYLAQDGFEMQVFDPIFFKDRTVLNRQYDFIVSCEVIEHFYDPLEMFKTMFHMLNPKGTLVCKTHLFHPGIEFDTWYYKNDPSHVFIYQAETFQWLKKHFKLNTVEIKNRVISLYT